MAARDGSRVQLDFPQLVADLIAQLSLTGTVGVLEFSDQVTPVYIVAQRAGALAFTATSPTFTSAGIFDGSINNPPANAIIADTGPLTAGDYDIFASLSVWGNFFGGKISLQHRNAANTTNLATLLHLTVSDTILLGPTIALPLIGYTIGLNERLRVENVSGVVDGQVSATIGTQIRPTP